MRPSKPPGAGEAGKGFAVVASEVKNLANQTAHATEEISQKIVTVQSISTEAVTAIRSIGGTIERMNEITEIITQSIGQQTAAASEISHNIQQASLGTAEVSSNIVDVTHAAMESSTAANDVLNAAQTLTNQAKTLNTEIQSFLQTVRKG